MAVTVCRDTPAHSSENTDLHDVIVECLQHSHFLDALNVAELYFEKTKSDESLLFVCECLLRLGRLNELYALLSSQPLQNPRVRFTYARCCFDLNRMDESMRTLTAIPGESAPSPSARQSRNADPVKLHPVLEGSPSAPYASVLLSKILCETGVEDGARHHSGQALQLNPFLWSAVTQYVQTGGANAVHLIDGPVATGGTSENEDPPRIEDVIVKQDSLEDEMEGEEDNDAHVTPVRTIVGFPRPTAPKKGRASEVADRRRSTRSSMTYGQDTENVGARRVKSSRTIPPILSLGSNTQNRAMTRANQVISEMPKMRASRSPTQKKLGESKQPLASRNANARSTSSQSISAAGSRSRRIDDKELQKEKDVEKERLIRKQDSGPPPHSQIYKAVFSAVRGMAEVEEAVSRYDWNKATQLLEALPAHIRKHALCSLQKARVVFEQCDYLSAREILIELRDTFPYRLEGMDLLSTALWHLQKNYELSALAQDLTARARDRAESWCAAGNCFSLQKMHTQAVECLRRAIRVDPHHSYAYALLGHELIEVDDVDQASQAFRKALTINPNDYRAWYGLGMVNHRKEQTLLAQRDLSRALALNKTNVSLLCQLAVVEKTLGKTEEAVRLLKYALQLDPNRTVSKFHLAKLQYEMGDFDGCIANLEELKVTSPDEAQIFFLLGKAHRRRNNTHLALLNFNWAAEMDPRGEQTMNYMNEQPFDDEGTP